MTVERHKIVHMSEAHQLLRKGDITASKTGALFDVHPYETRLKLFVEKSGVEFPTEETKTMRRGRWLEPTIGKAVSELRPDWTIEQANVYLRDPELRLGATPDFFIIGDPRGLGVLQAKSVAPSVYRRDWLDGTEPPLWITLQCLTEMMLADAAFGVIAALLVDPHQMDCVLLDVPRNPSAEIKIVGAVCKFWKQVAAGEEPAADYGRDAAVIAALAPQEVAGKAIDLAGDNYLPDLLAQRAQLKARIKVDEERCEEIETEVKFKMRDAERIVGIDGWRVTFKTGDRAGYTVPPKKLRTLRILDQRENMESS
jgi:predicted phage-related endonuclease